MNYKISFWYSVSLCWVVKGSKTTTDYGNYYLKSYFLKVKWKIVLICYKVHSWHPGIYETTVCNLRKKQCILRTCSDLWFVINCYYKHIYKFQGRSLLTSLQSRKPLLKMYGKKRKHSFLHEIYFGFSHLIFVCSLCAVQNYWSTQKWHFALGCNGMTD